jgi:hypothetical protein
MLAPPNSALGKWPRAVEAPERRVPAPAMRKRPSLRPAPRVRGDLATRVRYAVSVNSVAVSPAAWLAEPGALQVSWKPASRNGQ